MKRVIRDMLGNYWMVPVFVLPAVLAGAVAILEICNNPGQNNVSHAASAATTVRVLDHARSNTIRNLLR